jgi:DNA-binding transcriptional MerR regulator
MSSQSEAPAAGEFTIDELAARTGVPSRTIRFYQAKGVLGAPKKRGRVAVYDESHAERLKVVAELQDKGLRLRAIRDLISRPDLDSDAIHKWLGVGQQLGALSSDAPQLLDESELRQLLGDPPPGYISRLLRKTGIQTLGEGLNRRYLVERPALLGVAARLSEAGIDLDTAVALYEILQRRLGRAADEIVEYALGRVGRGFGRSSEPEDIQSALTGLFADGLCAESVRLVFAHEIERAVQEALKRGVAIPPRRRPR